MCLCVYSLKWKRASYNVTCLQWSHLYFYDRIAPWKTQQFCFCLTVSTTCCSRTAVMLLHLASLLLNAQTLKLNLYPFVLLLPLNPVPCREEILNKFSWLKDLVKIKRLRLKLNCRCLEKNLLAMVTRPRSYPNPCFKNP